MKIALLVSMLAAAGVASAQEARPGIVSVAQVASEADGKYTLDGKIVNASKLRRTIVQLDDQLPIYWLQLRRGGADITDEQLTQMRALASDIEAKLLVERDGAMVPDAAPAPAPAG